MSNSSIPSAFLSKTFDYVVVGGGTAGLALAARLSENPHQVVGVIEAGDYDPNVPEINVPGLCGRIIANQKFDWSFMSVPQSHANDRMVLQPRGKALGGSSMINLLGMSRPSKEDFDALEELGNKGWNWDSLLMYMKKSETLIPLSPPDACHHYPEPDLSLHGTDGPIIKSLPTWWNAMHVPMFQVLEVLGILHNSEPGNGTNIGAVTSLASIDPRSAKRSYAASAYYEPNASRQNLHIFTGAHVTKVLFEKHDTLQKATGVEFAVNGQLLQLKNIRKEVILAAGTFQSPQLLELSGIGNKDVLHKHGIEVLVELPGVGENLQDHVCVRTIIEIDSTIETLDILTDPLVQAEHNALYLQQKGMFSSLGAAAFAYLSAANLGISLKDIQWSTEIEDHKASIPSLIKQYELQRRWFSDPFQAQAELIQFPGHFPSPGPDPEKRYTSIIAALLHPFSRGSVHINTADPLAPPAIDPNYFSNPADLDLLLEVLKFTLKMYKTEPILSVMKAFVMPSQEIIDGGDDALREYVKQSCGPVYHPVGTAAMLPRDQGGVVDASLKVYGTSNLRVVSNFRCSTLYHLLMNGRKVDLSVLPLEVSCHTQSVAYAIGEMAADIIKGVLIRDGSFSGPGGARSCHL
ncbi:hypothetical protein SERLA73DRAFT_114907 [Serpula lacrymans var. lacrymans S7.3]|uniref:Glucose-methanol-choline oxidoreductase N-terminal domain-containing protein n=2 Tax=Serpula lacrymans var. lacrymans TaxID=341189 RepID=F8QBM0_SERL3|nr:uncharacterized protein SERLADRAFT_363842 [Serpula lacrymans var. lacrymans S7.9]EGN94606.1 hypothetical protein SERLA73DRAFT_114907 [Serpula lacrymans var. lacrymans S7.3]EGO20084.1 hypothetical protein SERLADRAFT_363842 [Serpula lacrymans var. lacrymans S7.9]